MRWMSLVVLVACAHAPMRAPSTATHVAASVEIGACADPAKDGVVSPHGKLERADRDLDGDGVPEIVTVDRSLCTSDDNCHWNVFASPDRCRASSTPEGRCGPIDKQADCARYLGTFDAARLEALASTGDANARDVRAYWNQSGERVLLQTYRFVRGGYRIVDVLQCKHAADDRLECADAAPLH